MKIQAFSHLAFETPKYEQVQISLSFIPLESRDETNKFDEVCLGSFYLICLLFRVSAVAGEIFVEMRASPHFDLGSWPLLGIQFGLSKGERREP